MKLGLEWSSDRLHNMPTCWLLTGEIFGKHLDWQVRSGHQKAKMENCIRAVSVILQSSVPAGGGDSASRFSWWNLTTMHVMLSALPQEKAVSVNLRAAASGSSSTLTSETASWLTWITMINNTQLLSIAMEIIHNYLHKCKWTKQPELYQSNKKGQVMATST